MQRKKIRKPDQRMENDGIKVLFITEGLEKPFPIRWHLRGDLEARQIPEGRVGWMWQQEHVSAAWNPLEGLSLCCLICRIAIIYSTRVLHM